MARNEHPNVGDIYHWAGKRWRVTEVLPVGVVKIVNVDRPQNTAEMPTTQFKESGRLS